MKARNRTLLSMLALSAATAASSAWAETPPSGAQRVAGYVSSGTELLRLPVTIPEGWILVLTDLDSCGFDGIRIYDDAARLQYSFSGSSSCYARSFNTGLAFTTPPQIRGTFSFSGYLAVSDAG